LREQGYDEQVEMVVALVAPKGLDAAAKAKLLDAANKLANDKETQEFITGNLLMRPVEWGEATADKTVEEQYKTFGEQAKKK
jgi:tripartite-type tricarboxylate transporter receptor subunit TctC